MVKGQVRVDQEELVGRIHVRRLELKEELSVIERRKGEIADEIRKLKKECPHVSTETKDDWGGGSCHVYEICTDCGEVRMRGEFEPCKRKGHASGVASSSSRPRKRS